MELDKQDLAFFFPYQHKVRVCCLSPLQTNWFSSWHRHTYTSSNRNVHEVRVVSTIRCWCLFCFFKLSNGVKLTHLMPHLLLHNTVKFGSFLNCTLAMKPDLVKQPVYSAAGSKPPKLGGPPSLIRGRGERGKTQQTQILQQHNTFLFGLTENFAKVQKFWHMLLEVKSRLQTTSIKTVKFSGIYHHTMFNINPFINIQMQALQPLPLKQKTIKQNTTYSHRLQYWYSNSTLSIVLLK